MPKKESVEKIYNIIFDMRDKLLELNSKAGELVNSVAGYGGIISSIITDQINKYFITDITHLIDDKETPGSIIGLINFLDSVPLAMTREEPKPEEIAPDSSNIEANLNTPPSSELPRNDSYTNRVESASDQDDTTEDNPADLDKESPIKQPTSQPTEPLINPSSYNQKFTSKQVQPSKPITESTKVNKTISINKPIPLKENYSYSKWVVIRETSMGSTLGKDVARPKDCVVWECDNEEDAKEKANSLNETVSPEEKNVFGTNYITKQHEFLKSRVEDTKIK